ncbi:unnamed protein product [Calicophoron daubneyi]|uniref:DNA-directed DNA polymerase n=1 Tax=Calicophoron daubneyi TaxID=300641 RepID=A0AAV2TGF2_CALDB
MGGQSPPGGLALISIAVCTIEKANGLINRLIEEGRLDELGLVIVDELHLIGDSHRGYLLELLLTKLLVYSRRVQESDSAVTSGTPAVCEQPDSSLVDEACQCARSFKGIQLIGMSATLPNLAQLGEWLDAAIYATDYRPVPLTELVFTRDPKNSVSHAYAVVPSKLTPSRALRGGTGEPSELLEPVASPVLDSQLSTETQLSVTDEDGVFGLCLDTLLSGHGVLVFCPTKQWCEQLADTMARHIFRLTKEHFAEKEHSGGPNTHSPDDCPTKVEDPPIGTRLATCLNRTRLASCVEQLKRCPSGLDPGLARCLGYAVAFHHAGLTVEEREIVENGFRAGFVRILVATSTLSSGVNLPARRVIIRTPLFHGQILDYLNYKQMAGRAGRKGVDTSGQSILLCKPRDLPRVRLMIRQGMPPVTSCLMGHGFSTDSSLRRAVLEVVANGFVETVADARLYLSSTLMMVCFNQSADGNRFASPSARKTPRRMSHSRRSLSNGSPIRADACPGDSSSNHLLELCISSLREHELLYIDSSPCSNSNCSDCRAQSEIGSQPSSVISKLQDCARLYPTALGRAVLSSSLGPVHGLVVFEELSKAQRAIALDTELHLIYLLTPVYLDVGAGLDWFRYLEQYQSLSPADRRVADLIGIEERFITRCAAGASSTKHSTASSGDGRLGRHRRFYTALALYRLVCEDELSTVAERFGLNRGLLQSLQQQAATYAGMVTVFCNRLGWVHMERLVANFQSRLFYGVSEELVDLVRLLPLVNVQRARALYSSGYTSVSALTNAKPRDIARILQRAVPFRSTDPDVEDFSKRGTIQLDDGTWVSEEEAAPLIVIKAQELLRSDLVGVYGTNVIILPTTTDSMVDPVESDAVNCCSVVISPVPLDEPAKDTSSPNSGLMQSSSLRPPLPVVQSAPDHGQTTSLLHHSLSSSDYEGVSEKRVRLSKSPCPSPSCNPCNHSESLRTSPLPLTDACAGTGQSTYPKYPVVEQITETVTPSKDENRSSPMQSGNCLSSQINDTFVLTTQIAALMDHASMLPQPEKPLLTKCSPPFSFQPENEWKIQSSTTPKALHPSACDPVKDLLATDRASDSPISATTVCLMNDTLTFSMLDDALESESPTVQPSNKPILSPLRGIKKSRIATAGVSPSTPTPTSESKLITETRIHDPSALIRLTSPSISSAKFHLHLSGDPESSSSVHAGVGVALSATAQGELDSSVQSTLGSEARRFVQHKSETQWQACLVCRCRLRPDTLQPGRSQRWLLPTTARPSKSSSDRYRDLSRRSPRLLKRPLSLKVSCRLIVRLVDSAADPPTTFGIQNELYKYRRKIMAPRDGLLSSSWEYLWSNPSMLLELVRIVMQAHWRYAFRSVSDSAATSSEASAEHFPMRDGPHNILGGYALLELYFLVMEAQPKGSSSAVINSINFGTIESMLTSSASDSLTPTNDVNISSDSILCVIDVTRQKSLWQIFMEDFLIQLHYHGESGPASRAIAIQPCWVISSLEVDEINFPLAWHSGPAGSARLGGGVEMHSAKHPLRLTLRGFAISSSLLHPKAVFWIGLNDGHLSALYLDGIRKLLRELQLTNHTLVVWDSKWWFRLVQDVLDIPVTESPPVLDPGILGWLYDPDQGRPKLVSEVAKFGLEMQNLVAQLEALDLVREPPGQHSDWTHLVSSLSDINDSGDTSCPPSRLVEFPCSPDVPGFITVAAIQCFLLSKWTDSKLFCLSKVPKILVTLEIPCHALLAKLESTGFVLDISLLRECHASLLLSCKILEKVAYRLAGQNFQLDSPREVSKILFNELRLPQLTDNSDCIAAKKRSRVSLFSNARFRSRAADHLPRATNALLLRLSGLHPLPSVVIEWRHLHFLLEKTFASLMTHCEALVKQRIDCKNDLSKCNHLRISPTYDVCTATGRIVSCVPNIQAVPNDITIDFPALLVRPTSSSLTSLLGKTHEPQISDLSSSIWPDAISEALSDVPKEVKIIRPREAFCASLGGLLISGDFCQLELRLLAHFSRDEHLLELLSAADSANVIRDSAMPPPPSADAFRRLASYWLKIPNPTMVTSAQRQQAKQLCYALVYGMGAQGLAAQLDVTEQTAQSLIDSFLRTYPGVQRFITETVQGAHRHGYVSTLGGRIRLLPVLKENSVNSDDSPNPFAGSTAAYGHGVEARRFFAISKAERQAVNTVIQGSAAEIAKMAMLSVDSVLTANVSEGRCQLVLHEHDELVYEVHPADAGAKFGSLIRHTMSSVCQKCNLSVQLPVKLRAGPNWADLEEVLW